MTKKDIITNLRTRESLTWEQATRIVNSIFDEMANELVQRNDVYIPKFGRIYVSNVAAKSCKHPVTRESGIVPAHDIVRFRMAEELKRKLKGLKR